MDKITNIKVNNTTYDVDVAVEGGYLSEVYNSDQLVIAAAFNDLNARVESNASTNSSSIASLRQTINGLSTVATSGSYNDLTDKPTIPVVNNATLTIKRNNASVGTFTANASSAKTINITVPTNTSDLTNDVPFVKEDDMFVQVEDANGHEYVEIAGIKWATMNVGANSITGNGLYFQWGDAQGYTASQVGTDKNFSWSDYKYTTNGDWNGINKYQVADGQDENTAWYDGNGNFIGDNKTVLEASDDAASVNWGGSWRMPTTEEFQALGTATTSAWTADYQGSGVAGLVLTSKADSSKVLFFPAAGDCINGSVNYVGSNGYYWSSSLSGGDVSFAYYLDFISGYVYWNNDNTRDYGYPVRGVLDSTISPKYATKQELSTLERLIDAKISSAYHHAGTKTVSQLTNTLLTSEHEGEVYNITDSGTTTSDFIEGAGITIKVGDNVGVAKVGTNTYKFDILSGFVDTSGFANKSELTITSGSSADKKNIQLKNGTSQEVLISHQDISGKANKNDLSAINNNNHQYVDLGLPSGTLWATTNVGASSETDYGNYYQVGQGATQYNISNPAYTSNVITRSVDTATQVWGGSWHTPTLNQIEELIDNTTKAWSNDYNGSGIAGMIFTGANNNTIFLPAAGSYGEGGQLSETNELGYYLSSTNSPTSSSAWDILCIYDHSADADATNRTHGSSIRPVLEITSLADIDNTVSDLTTVATRYVSSKEDINTPNTKYIINHDINLNNSSITIPQNCTIEFEKGTISNGTVVLQNTTLEGNVSWSGVTISGSCANDILTPQMFGATPSLTETESNKTQHTLGFLNLVRVIDNPNTLSKVVYIPTGHYSINQKILFMNSCTVYGDDGTSVIHCYDGSGGIGFGYTTSGNYYYSTCQDLNCTITQDAEKLQDYIVVDDASELSIGDYLILTDSQDYSFNHSRTYYRNSEFLKINNIEGNRVTFATRLYGYYFANFGEDYVSTLSPTPANRTLISKFVPKQYNIQDLKIISHEHQNQTPETYYTFIATGFENSCFKNIYVENYGNQVSCCLKMGINYMVDGCVIKNYATYTTDAYGLVINNSRDFKVLNSKFRAPSHALSTGGGSSRYDTINRNFVYENLFFETSQYNSNLSEYGKIDLDVHGDSEYYKFININCPHVTCDSGGYNVTIDNCKFYKIASSFNESDITIRNCEIFTEEDVTFLIWNENAYRYLGNNSIIFDNNRIHGDIIVNGQSSSLIYDNIIFKNNVCKSFKLRNGHIKNIIVENNSFGAGSVCTTTNCIFDNISIKLNTFLDGYLWVLSGEESNCIISDNYITTTTAPLNVDTLCVFLSKVNGYFVNNIIIRNIANYHTPIAVVDGTLKINNNIIKLSDEGLNKQLVKSSRSKIILSNNMHNSTSAQLILTTDGSAADNLISFGFSDYYFDLTSNTTDKLSIKEAIGQTFYNEKTNRLGYSSIVRAGLPNKTGNALCVYFADTLNGYISNKSGNKYIIDNPFQTDIYYFTTAGKSGNHKLYLSKTNDFSSENFNDQLLLIHTFSSGEKSFLSPDITEYPYLCIERDDSSNSNDMTLRIYPSRVVSDYDGAAFNVKRVGTSSERPSGYDIYPGFEYIDTTLGKPIYAKSIHNAYFTVTWVEPDGAVAGVARTGTTSQRPTGSNIYVGFKYFDTTLNKEIYASAISGNTVTWTEVTTVPQIWTGTLAQYNALSPNYDSNTIYIIS